MISETTIQAVRELPIETVIGHYVKLKRAGANMQGLCPFHNESTPSFSVSLAKQFYYCFGCGAGGDGIKFVMEQEKLTFTEAVEHLAYQHNVIIEYEAGKAPDPAVKEKNNNLRKTLNIAAAEYHKLLTGNDDETKAITGNIYRYLVETRRLTNKSITQWKLGFADDKNRLSKSLERTTAIEAGIVKESEQYLVPYDFFKNRIIIPITDKNGDVISFGGRKLPTDIDKQHPKFLNTANTIVYDKSKTLFGLSQAVRSIREQKCAILVEGYFDVIKLHQWGWTNTVATCGTALTDEHAKLLRRYTETIIIMRDGDIAGRKATLRDVEILCEHFSDIRICWLHDGVDPDSYFDCWDEANFLSPFTSLEDAFLWKCRELLEDAAGDTVFTSAAITESATLLAKLPNQLQRDMYVQQLCKEFKLKEKQFKTALTDKLQQQSGSLFPDDEIPKWVNLSGFYNDGFVMNNNKDKDRVGIYFKTESRAIVRLTNYIIKPLYFIMDQKNPRRLIEMYNGSKSYIIELPKEAMTKPAIFEDYISSRPGFWSEEGFGKNHFKRLSIWINANTQTVFELKKLGWQPEGFFALTDKIVVPSKIHQNGTLQGVISYNEYGFAPVGETNYLSPAVSKMNNDFRQDENMYENDLYLKYAESPITFAEWAKLFCEVYGTGSDADGKPELDQHGAFGIAFIFLSAFMDIVTRTAKKPKPYFYGPKGSGKSTIGESMMWFFFSGKDAKGKLIQGFNLSPGQSSPYSFFNSGERFRNVFRLYNEFDPQNIEPWKRSAFKSDYDGEGRDMGSGESFKNRKTEISRMTCVAGIAGQYLDTADDAAMLSRCVPFKFSLEKNNALTQEQKALWKKLNDYENEGICSLACALYEHRDTVQKQFAEVFWSQNNKLTADMRKRHYVPETRVVNNYSVCLALILIMQECVPLPFTYEDFYLQCLHRAIEQTKLLKDNNILSSFWSMMEVIFAEGHFEEGLHFKIKEVTEVRLREGNEDVYKKLSKPTKVLYLRINMIHDKISIRHKVKTGKEFPSEDSISTYLKDQGYYIGSTRVEYFRDMNTNSFVLNYDLMTTAGVVVLEKEVQLT